MISKTKGGGIVTWAIIPVWAKATIHDATFRATVAATVGETQLNAAMSGCGFVIGSRQRSLQTVAWKVA